MLSELRIQQGGMQLMQKIRFDDLSFFVPIGASTFSAWPFIAHCMTVVLCKKSTFVSNLVPASKNYVPPQVFLKKPSRTSAALLGHT